MGSYGINDDLRYYEFELDSYSAYTSFTSTYTKENWPLFSIGGKNPLKNIAAIKILEVQIPFQYYIFTSANNTFLLTENGESASTVTIPVGNYTVTTFLVALKVALDLASVGGTVYVYTVTFDTPTGKIRISNGSTPNNPFTFTFGTATDMGYTNPRRYMGFPAGSTTSQTFVATTPGNTMVTPFPVNLSGPNYIFVNSGRIGTLCDQYLPALTTTVSNSGPQVAKIAVNVNSGGVISWVDPDPQKWFNLDGLNSLLDIDFYLTLGENPALIDLNGLNFVVKLGVLERVSEQTTVSKSSYENRGVKRVRDS